MIEACVSDTSAHLGTIQKQRDDLEAGIAEGKSDEDITLKTQQLAQSIKDYRAAAAHVKKHITKPKKAKDAKEPDTSAPATPATPVAGP